MTLLLAMLLSVQGACMPYNLAAEKLAELSDEVIVGRGLKREGPMIEVWADLDDGSWTVLQVTPDGRACLMSYGEDWHVPLTPEPGAGT
jgi:hypothetical protein